MTIKKIELKDINNINTNKKIYPITENDIDNINKIFSNNIKKKIIKQRKSSQNNNGMLQLITLNSLTSGGEYKTITNIILNWKETLEAFIITPLGTISLFNTYLTPSIFLKSLLFFTLAIYSLSKIKNTFVLKINEEDGLLLWIIHHLTFYSNNEVNGKADFNNIMSIFYKFQKKYNLKCLDKENILERLLYLESIGCIEQKNRIWKTKEIVIVK